jgi:cell division protein FtsN
MRSRTDYRTAHSRELGYEEDEPDDLFEEDQNYQAQPARRASPEAYAQAYREYDPAAYDQQERRRRTGPFLLIAALAAVGVIAGALIYFYQQSSTDARAPSGAELPVVAEPSEPVKTAPDPATADTAAPEEEQQSRASSPETQVPSQKKQIYDRILGETTLEEQEQVVPSEEQPVTPEGPVQGLDTDPLPLPMPPPPGGSPEDQSGSLSTPTQTQSATETQSTAANKSAAANVSQQASPAAASLETQPETATTDQALPPPDNVAPAGESTTPAPEPQPMVVEKKTESKLASVEKPASSGEVVGSGPIQIAQLPASDAPTASITSPDPQALPDPVVKRRLTGRASERTVGAGNRNFNRAKSESIAELDASPITTQSIAPSTGELQTSVEPPSQAPAPAVQPEKQQQAALPSSPQTQSPQAAPSAGPGFYVQLASYKSEAEALVDYGRLSQRHASLVSGLAPDIQRSDLGSGNTFYRLSLGKLPSKQAAKDLCTSLLAAGERDCLVKAR